MVLTQACRVVRETILRHGNQFCWPLSEQLRQTISELGLNRRGCRAGRHVQARRLRTSLAEAVTRSAVSYNGEIPVVTGNRPVRVSVSEAPINNRSRCLSSVRREPVCQSMRIGLFNARSVSEKSAAISTWIGTCRLNVAAITETWHDGADSPQLVACAPDGYQLVEQARQRHGADELSMSTNHGGVCLLVDSSLRVRRVTLPTSTSFEAVCAYVHRSGLNAFVVCVYRRGSRSATDSFFTELADLLECMAPRASPVVIVGDFNIHVDDVSDPIAAKFDSLVSSYGYCQHVKQSTHRAGHVLDLILTNSTDLSVDVHPISPALLSDHAFVIAEVTNPSPLLPCTSSELYHSVRQWRKLDVDAFAADLQASELWRTPPDDVDAAFNSYNDTLRQLVDRHVPCVSRRPRRRTYARWYDDECRTMKRTTRRLEKVYHRSRLDADREAWRRQFSNQRQLYQTKFTAYWSATINDCRDNPRKLWRTVNAILKAPTHQADARFNADDFAEFFQSKVRHIRDSTAMYSPPVIQTHHCSPLSSFDPVTDTEIRKILSTCPITTSVLDPIPSWLLKQLSHLFIPVICHLCNLSLQSGIFPSSHSRAVVLPRLKKPTLDPDSLSSYRPISNLSFLSKLVERAVARRYLSHLTTNSLLPSRQSAYRPFHSVETTLVSVYNDLVRGADNGLITGLILLDLSSAFDTVDHSILLSTLTHRHATCDSALSWFQSYLENRTQYFSVAGNTTADFVLDCSVPQGSVLGPLLFISYTAEVIDVFDRHSVQFHLFADDKQSYVSGRVSEVDDIRRQLADCAEEVAAWCASHRLQLNAGKTELIWFGSRTNNKRLSGNDLSIKIGSETIKPVRCVRDLGVYLDDELSMKQHINTIARSCFYHLRRLRQIRRRAGQEVTVRLVLALVMSRIDFCNALFAGLPVSTIAPLQRVQNAAARLVLQLGPRDHITQGLRQLHWLPIHARVLYKLCVLMYDVHVGNSPSYIRDIVTTLLLAADRAPVVCFISLIFVVFIGHSCIFTVIFCTI